MREGAKREAKRLYLLMPRKRHLIVPMQQIAPSALAHDFDSRFATGSI